VIVLPRAVVGHIADAAEAAYPDECCGLLVGRAEASGNRLVTRVAASPNVAEGNTRDSFLVDPRIQFDLMRELGDGPESIVGHYHSHPDHGATPSERDRQSVFYPDHVWVIVAVDRGRAGDMTAHLFDAGRGRFREIPLRVTG
jgi:proteasome lid subunit RPN8/RPN11